jgi:hypothetical protein
LRAQILSKKNISTLRIAVLIVILMADEGCSCTTSSGPYYTLLGIKYHQAKVQGRCGGLALQPSTSCFGLPGRLRPLTAAFMPPFPPVGRRGLRQNAVRFARRGQAAKRLAAVRLRRWRNTHAVGCRGVLGAAAPRKGDKPR